MRKKFTMLLASLFLVMGTSVAQTAVGTIGNPTTTLTDGKYVVVAMSDKGTGPCYYDKAVGNKPYRYNKDKTINVGDVVTSDYVWTIDETTEDGVQHITITNFEDNTKFFVKDAAKNLNFSGSDMASLKVVKRTVSETDYITLTLDDVAIGYIHANAPGGNPCLSYWDGIGDGGSGIKFTFYPVEDSPFYTSVAPTEMTWDPNTVWYFIQFPNSDLYHTGGYLAAEGSGFMSGNGFTSNVSNGHLLITQTEKPIKYSALWCIVGDEENGYKFYNRMNPKLILGTDNGNKTRLYLASETKDNVNYAYDYAASTNTKQGLENCATFRLRGKDAEGNYVSTTKYWNNQDASGSNPDYLSVWNDGRALSDNGSAIRLTQVTEHELAEMVTKTPESSTIDEKKYYTIKNQRSNDYATHTGDATQLKHLAQDLNNGAQVWYFTADGNGYRVHNLATTNKYKNTSSFTADGAKVWVKENPYCAGFVCISTQENLGGNCWDSGNNNLIGTWNPRATDYEGTSWMLEEVSPTATLPLAKLDAKLHVTEHADYLGDGLGQAYYVVDGNKVYDADAVKNAIDAAAAIESVTAIKQSYTVVSPAAVALGSEKYFVYYTDGEGTKHYLQIAEDGTFGITETPVSFKFDAGVVTDGYASSGVYYMRMNGYTLSHWNSSNSTFHTNNTNNTGLWHCQAITYNPLTQKYAIRSTNATGTSSNAHSYVTISDGAISAQLETSNVIADLYQWNIRQDYPFTLTTDDESPVYYAIRNGRNTDGKDWWFTYDESDGKIALSQYTGEAVQLWYFKEVVEENGAPVLRLFPKSGNGMAMSYENTNTGDAKIIAKNLGTQGWTNTWTLVSTNDKAPYGLKTSDGKNFLSNIHNVTYKIGMWNDIPGNDPGTAMYISTEVEAVQSVITKAEAMLPGEGTAVGYYTSSSIDNLEAAIATAKINLESENYVVTELNAAMEAVAVILPEAGKYYHIRSANPSFFAKQGKEMGIYSSNAQGQLAWKALDGSDKAFYWTITPKNGTFVFKNEADGKYVPALKNDAYAMTATESEAAEFTLTWLAPGQFNINGNGTMHMVGHSEGAGSGDRICSWSGGINSSSAWTIVEVEHPDLSMAKAGLQNRVDQLNTIIANMGSAIGQYKDGDKAALQEHIATAQGVLNSGSAVPNEYTTAKDALEEAIAGLDYSLILPQAGKHYLIKSAKPEFFANQGVEMAMYSDASNGLLYWKALDEGDRTFYWAITPNNDGTSFVFQNAGDGKYIPAINNDRYTMTEDANSAQSFNLSFLGSRQFNITGSGTMHMMGHSNGNGKKDRICGFDGGLNTPSAWYIIEIDNLELTIAKAQFEAAKFDAIQRLNFLGTAPGFYSSSLDNPVQAIQSYINFDYENATKDAIQIQIDGINSIVSTLTVNLPIQGKFYRFGYDYGDAGVKYVQAEASNVSGKAAALVMTEAKDNASIFYYDGGVDVENSADDRLLSYSTGLYVKEDGNVARGLQTNEATSGGTAKFEPGSVAGKLYIFAGHSFHANQSSEIRFVDHCENGHADEHNFIVEEVDMTSVIEGLLPLASEARTVAERDYLSQEEKDRLIAAADEITNGTFISDPTVRVNALIDEAMNVMTHYGFADQLFRLKQEKSGLYMKFADPAVICAKSYESDQVFSFESTAVDGEYNLKSLSGLYMQVSGYFYKALAEGDSEVKKHKLEYIGRGKYRIKTASGYVASDNTVDQSQLYSNKSNNDENGVWILEAEKKTKVIYTLKHDGKTIATEEHTGYVGYAYPEIKSTFFGVTSDLTNDVIDEGDIVDGQICIDVNLSVGELPFVAAEDASEINNWYFVQMHSNNKKYIQYLAGENYIEWKDAERDVENLDSYTWAFVGNVFDGFKLVNRSATIELALVSNGSGNPAMGQFDSGTNFVLVDTKESVQGGFCLQYPQGNYLNAQGEKVAHHDDNDAGSTFVITERDLSGRIELQALVDAVKGVYTAGEGVGYPTQVSIDAINAAIGAAESALNGTITPVISQQHMVSISNAVAALEINMPQEDVFYTILNVTTGKYMNVHANTGMTVSATAGMGELFQFVPAADGKFYLYNVERGTYLSTAKPHNGGQNFAGAVETTSAKAVTITNLGKENQVSIVPDNGATLHDNNYGIVLGWNEGKDSKSAWKIVEADLTGLTRTVTVGDFGYSTLYLNYATIVPEIEGEDNGVYVASEVASNYVALTQVEAGHVLPAKTGVIIKAPEGDYTFTYSSEENNNVTSAFEGTLINEIITPAAKTTYYVLANGDNGVGLYKAKMNRYNNGSEVPKEKEDGTRFLNNANKVYLPVGGGQNAPALVMRFGRGQGTTEIELPTANGQQPTAVYDLQGRRVLNPTKGMYIINGKKVVIR